MFLRSLGFRFVNADWIARGLPGDDRAEASYTRRGTGGDRAPSPGGAWRHLRDGDRVLRPGGRQLEFLRDARAPGYHVAFVYIGLASAALSQARVIQRVAQGGHDVPDDRIRTRLPRSLANAREALRFVDVGWVFDNSDADHPFQLVATTRVGLVTDLLPSAPRWCRSMLPPKSG